MPLAQAHTRPEEIASGIDEAAARLEQAFDRLERAVRASRAAQLSLKEDQAKLNLLLHQAQDEAGRLRAAVTTVSERLERVIVNLEQVG